MHEQPVDMKAAESAIERVKVVMESRGITLPKKKKKQRAIPGRKAALATKQRLHYAREVDRVREKNPRFKGFRTTLPSRGAAPVPGPSEKALARAAARQS